MNDVLHRCAVGDVNVNFIAHRAVGQILSQQRKQFDGDLHAAPPLHAGQRHIGVGDEAGIGFQFGLPRAKLDAALNEPAQHADLIGAT